MPDEVSSEPTGDPASPPLTVTDYRAQATAICEAANRQLNDHMPSGSLPNAINFSENTARTAYDELGRLQPPPELGQLHAEMLVRTHALLAGFPPLVEAAKTGTAAFAHASAEQAERNTKLGDEVAALWEKLGVPACNQ